MIEIIIAAIAAISHRVSHRLFLDAKNPKV